jgi:hypothetical protein
MLHSEQKANPQDSEHALPNLALTGKSLSEGGVPDNAELVLGDASAAQFGKPSQ